MFNRFFRRCLRFPVRFTTPTVCVAITGLLPQDHGTNFSEDGEEVDLESLEAQNDSRFERPHYVDEKHEDDIYKPFDKSDYMTEISQELSLEDDIYQNILLQTNGERLETYIAPREHERLYYAIYSHFLYGLRNCTYKNVDYFRQNVSKNNTKDSSYNYTIFKPLNEDKLEKILLRNYEFPTVRY